MASNTILKVECDSYLIPFLETLYGKSPITFPKGSNFNSILDWIERDWGKNTLLINLRYLEHKNVVSNYYLSPIRQRILTSELKRYFKITFRTELSKLIVMGLNRKDSIELFCEKYNLSQDAWDMLEKDYQRYLKLRSYHKLFRPRKNSSDNDPVCPATSNT